MLLEEIDKLPSFWMLANVLQLNKPSYLTHLYLLYLLSHLDIVLIYRISWRQSVTKVRSFERTFVCPRWKFVCKSRKIVCTERKYASSNRKFTYTWLTLILHYSLHYFCSILYLVLLLCYSVWAIVLPWYELKLPKAIHQLGKRLLSIYQFFLLLTWLMT